MAFARTETMNLPEALYPIGDTLFRSAGLLRGVFGFGIPLQRQEGFAPFFVVGSGRCGSTLLRRILQASDEVHIPPEAYSLPPARHFVLRHRDRSWSYVVRNVLAFYELHPEFGSFELSLRGLVPELLELSADRRSLARIIDAIYRYHGQQRGQTFTRWGDKTPLHSFHMPEILQVFPDARFIHLIRDGADVAASRLQAGFEADITAAARRWQSAVNAVQAFARQHTGICLDVRYEHLVSETVEAVKTICAFLDLHFDASMIESREHAGNMGDVGILEHHKNVFRPVNPDSIGRGRRALTAQQLADLHRVIGRDLQRLGYDPLD